MTHPTPWRHHHWIGDLTKIRFDQILDADNRQVFTAKDDEDAAEVFPRIVKAVNAHDDLVAALRALVKALTDNDDEGLIEHADQMIAARAALEKAGV